MSFIADGFRTVVFNANVTGTDAVRRLVAVRTHPEQAIDTYLSTAPRSARWPPRHLIEPAGSAFNGSTSFCKLLT